MVAVQAKVVGYYYLKCIKPKEIKRFLEKKARPYCTKSVLCDNSLLHKTVLCNYSLLHKTCFVQ